MKVTSKPRIFATQNVDLATYLMFQGIELIDCIKMEENPKIAQIRFKDPYGKCLDLERLFLNSDFKKYREYQKYLLQLIFKTLKS